MEYNEQLGETDLLMTPSTDFDYSDSQNTSVKRGTCSTLNEPVSGNRNITPGQIRRAEAQLQADRLLKAEICSKLCIDFETCSQDAPSVNKTEPSQVCSKGAEVVSGSSEVYLKYIIIIHILYSKFCIPKRIQTTIKNFDSIPIHNTVHVNSIHSPFNRIHPNRMDKKFERNTHLLSCFQSLIDFNI